MVIAQQVLAIPRDLIHHRLGIVAEHDLDIGRARRPGGGQAHFLGHLFNARLDRGGLGVDQAQHLDADRIVPAADLVDLGIGRRGVTQDETLALLLDHLRLGRGFDRDRSHRGGRRRRSGGGRGGLGQGGGCSRRQDGRNQKGRKPVRHSAENPSWRMANPRLPIWRECFAGSPNLGDRPQCRRFALTRMDAMRLEMSLCSNCLLDPRFAA